MPWTYKDAKKHNKNATGANAHLWASVANSVLKKGMSDAHAIKVANAAVKKLMKK